MRLFLAGVFVMGMFLAALSLVGDRFSGSVPASGSVRDGTKRIPSDRRFSPIGFS